MWKSSPCAWMFTATPVLPTLTRCGLLHLAFLNQSKPPFQEPPPCIFDYMLGKNWRADKDVLEGMQWINKNFLVTDNPGRPGKWHYYYLYGLERAGMLFGTETIGDHKWYREGAEQLLSAQSGGGWGNVVDTCFAILFLRRATRPLNVATGGGRR